MKEEGPRSTRDHGHVRGERPSGFPGAAQWLSATRAREPAQLSLVARSPSAPRRHRGSTQMGGGSHCAGWGALEEARFAVAESRSSRSKGGQRPGATRHVLRVRGGSIRQVGKPRARSTDATGCGEPSAGAGSSPPPCQEAAAADAAGGLPGRWADRLASHASARGSSGHGRGCRSRPTIVILVSILVMLSSESCCRRCGPRHVGAAPGRARGRGRGGRCLCRWGETNSRAAARKKSRSAQA